MISAVFNRNAIGKSIATVLGLLAAIMLCSILLIIFGINPVNTFASIFTKSLGTAGGMAQTFVAATPILLVAVGVELANRAGVINLGAEGQIVAGAIVAQVVALNIYRFPSAVGIALVLFAGLLGGAIYTLIPAVLKVKLEVNEIVLLIMTNQIISYIVAWLVRSPLKDTNSSNNQGELINENLWFPNIFGDIHIGVVIAIILTIVVYLILKKTVFGYEISVVGKSKKSADYAGISKNKIALSVFLLSGAIAGLAGSIQVLGVQHRLTGSISNGYGWSGIMVAMVAGKNPVALIIVTVLYSALDVGNLIIQITDKVPTQLAEIVQAIIVLAIVVARNIYDNKKQNGGEK